MSEICRCLRWKGYHRDLDPDELELTFLRNHVPYGCLKTGQPWGDDGDLAVPELCHRDRECFESPRSLMERIRSRWPEPGPTE